MTDTKQICGAIKGMPDGDTIRWQSRTTIESGEVATNDLYTLLRHYPNALAEVRQIPDVIEWWLDKAYGVTPCVMVRYDRDDPKTERIRVGDQSDLEAKLANQREFLNYVARQSKTALAIIQREGFVFGHSGGRWEKLAFTLYSDLVAISTDARHQLEEMEENNDER